MARTIDQILQNWHQYGTVEGPDIKVLIDTVIRQRNAGKDQARKIAELQDFIDKSTQEMKAQLDKEVKAAIKKLTAGKKTSKEEKSVDSGKSGNISTRRPTKDEEADE